MVVDLEKVGRYWEIRFFSFLVCLRKSYCTELCFQTGGEASPTNPIRYGFLRCEWEFIVRLPGQFATSFLLLNASPLLKEERNIACAALMEQVTHPRFLHWSCSRPALAADYYPVNI